MSPAKRFPRACVASPHHLASSTGLAVLASGGNAIDAAVATNLTLGVVGPYMCGYGGDLFALVFDGERLHAYNGSGRSGTAATAEVVRDAVSADVLPTFGPHTVTVPGAVRGWFDLLDRFGTRAFGDLASMAISYARDGFALWSRIRDALPNIALAYADDWGAQWRSIYGDAPEILRQPDLAKTIELLCTDGPDAYYRGPIGEAIAHTLQRYGAFITSDDLAAHTGDWPEPVSTTYRGVEVFEHPPNSQGPAALIALNIVEDMDLGPPESAQRQHVLIEAMKLALLDRNEHITDPAYMKVSAAELVSKSRASAHREMIDLDRASAPAQGHAAVGGTIYLCAADSDGMLVSLIQSNYKGFGSGVTVPGWGINLHNRGRDFSLDPSQVNVIAPNKRTMHTLSPAMVFRDGKPWIVFGTEGGDGQVQTHLQVLTAVIDDGLDIQDAMDRPRWAIEPTDWTVGTESRFGEEVLNDLERRGHAIKRAPPWRYGFSNGIEVRDFGYAAATDQRIDGAALGL